LVTLYLDVPTDEATILGDFISHDIRENIYYLMETQGEITTNKNNTYL